MKKWINISIVFIVMILVFVLGIFRGTNKIRASNFGHHFPMDRAVRDSKIKPPFVDAQVFRIGENFKINGIKTDIYGINTKNPVTRVISYYLNLWKSQGLDAVSDISRDTGYAAFFDEQKKQFKIVSAYKDSKSKSTIAFIATSFYDQKPQSARVKGLPNLPGAQSLIHL